MDWALTQTHQMLPLKPPTPPLPPPEAFQHAVHSEHTVRGGYIRFQAQFAPRFYSLLTELCAAKHFQKTVKT